VYTAHDFKIDATNAIEAVTERNHLPIIVGGTFFYLDTLRGRTGGAPVPPNPELRLTLEAKTLPELQALLESQDSQTAATIDTQNPRRLIRALEILAALGHIPETRVTDSPYDWLIIGLLAEKTTLRARYRERALTWLQQGFLAEISGLLEAGTSRKRLQEFGFEYTLGLALLEQEISEAEFIDRFEQKNWQYAKRQLTWLKRDEEVTWFDPANQSGIQAAVESFLAN
jgi:tRNA dimethylallyltransferase